MSEIKITECRCCGNRDAKQFIEKGDGYICKCCGVWFRYETGEEREGCLAGYRQLRKYNFEDARDTFEEVLINYPRSVDARWGLLLARFGVVYIKGFYDDVIEPVYCFPDYEVLEGRTFQNEDEYKEMRELIGADTELKYLYDAKAREIDRAIKKFRDCKDSTERDVFICVKISASTEKEKHGVNERTKDYEFALKAYKDLQARGKNVFFSFVTLKNEVNSDDLIWLNLVKSKKMLLIGSREDYLESAWVKSEWKRWRFLERQKDMYICVLNDSSDNPKNVLPYELRKDAPQIYTPDTYAKLLDDICGVEYTPVASQAQTSAPVHFVGEEKKKISSNPRDGKIVYKDGREEVLDYITTKIDDYAYRDNHDIVSVDLPKNLIIIGKGAFSGCGNLEKITIPSSVREICSEAFYGCEKLTSVAIANGVTKIGMHAFARCAKLDSIILPETLKEIGYGTFEFCIELKDVTIPNSVTSIGWEAFQYCDSLERITIPNSVTSISAHAFDFCESLKSITIPDSVTSIGASAFAHCPKLERVTLPDSLKEISAWTFSGCECLGKINISGGVENIGVGAFYGCENLKITISPENKNYMVINNNIYTIGGKTIVAYMPKENERNFTIPNSVTEIGSQTFYKCDNLISVTIPKGVNEIGNGAFGDCLHLKDIYFNGKASDWKKISIHSGNDAIASAKIHFKTLFGYTK